MKRFEDAAWRESMRLKLDVNNMMADALCAAMPQQDYAGKDQGITQADLDAIAPQIAHAVAEMKKSDTHKDMRWTDLPYNQGQIVADIQAEAEQIRAWATDFVVLGIGGSALGPIAVQQALNHLHYNDLPAAKRGGPRLYVEDNVDPERMLALFDVIDPKTTVFNVISKSGTTSETMAQFLIVADMLKKTIGEGWQKHIVATTSKDSGQLIKIVKKENFKVFYIPDGVGGRFSELCPVGLLAAAVCGIDIQELLAGAAYMDGICRKDGLMENPALLNAALMYIAMNKGKNISVMMPYADSLKYMADWYAQLWAESLGKKFSLTGEVVNAGQTPVKSLGVTDQHSQVQLYAEGPFDKVLTFLAVENYRGQMDIAHGYEEIKDVAFLGGHSMNKLIGYEQKATEFALVKQGKINETLILPEVNAFTVGELLYFFEMQTAYAGFMMGINTFDQPGVEQGKISTYGLMGREGFEADGAEVKGAQAAKKDAYIL
ncbi:MAG: glucose-6-phosphate isomerase [Christensenellales bacterium]|jgi:glucose-6-phosphate isomerase